MKFKYSMNEKWKIYKYLISLYMTRISYVTIIKNKILLNKNREKIYDFNINCFVYICFAQKIISKTPFPTKVIVKKDRDRERESLLTICNATRSYRKKKKESMIPPKIYLIIYNPFKIETFENIRFSNDAIFSYSFE